MGLAFTSRVSVRGGRPAILVPEEHARSLPAPGPVVVELRAGDIRVRLRGRVARLEGRTYIALPRTALALRGAYVVAAVEDPDGDPGGARY
jgi:hypothetical protein